MTAHILLCRLTTGSITLSLPVECNAIYITSMYIVLFVQIAKKSQISFLVEQHILSYTVDLQWGLVLLLRSSVTHSQMFMKMCA